MTPQRMPDAHMVKRIKVAMLTTWNHIAADIVDASGGTCTSEVAQEMVADANRMMEYGGDEEAVRIYEGLDYQERDILLRGAFNLEFV